MNVAENVSDKNEKSEELQTTMQSFVEKYSLSKREHDVLHQLVNQVVSAEDISEKLGISRNTVRIHLKNINTKVGTSSKSELLGRFIEFVIQNKDDAPPEVETKLSVLICDDDDSYVDLVKRATESAIGENVEFMHKGDGQQLLEHLERVKHSSDTAKPNLILLDLNMPKLNGFQTLERLKTDPMLSAIPVVVFTSSSTQTDISSIYALGGNSYVTKPGGYQELKKVMQGIISYWANIGALPKN